MKAFIKFQTVFSGRFQTVQENASLIRVIDGLRFEPNRPKLVLSLYPDRDPAGYLTFRFRSNLSNVTDFNCVQIPSSHSHRPSQSSAGERRRRTRGRGRDEVGLIGEIYFYEGIWVFLLKGKKKKKKSSNVRI